MRRLVAAVAAAVLCATALVACSHRDDLLVVNGWALSRSDFLDELNQIAHNQAYLDARARNGQPLKIFKDGSTTDYAPELVVEFLNERVTFQLAAAELAKRKLTVTDDDRAAAIAVINDGLATAGSVAPTGPPGTIPAASPGTSVVAPGGSTPAPVGSAVLDGFGSYRDVLITGVADLQVLRRALTGDVSTDDQLRSLYERLKDQYATQACARHLLIRAGSGAIDPHTGTPVTPTDLEYANALSRIVPIKAQLTGGADFATVAAAQSEDPATKAKGGDLGCAPRGHYDTAFDDAIWNQPVGVVGDPVKSAYGYHLVVVTERRVKSFDEVKDVLRQAVADQGQQALQEWLATASRTAAVIVDPAAGSWNAATGLIDPPAGSVQVSLVPDQQGTVPGTAPGTTVPSLVPKAGS